MSEPSLQITRLIAAGAHALAGQTYGDGQPYNSEHLNEVAAVLRSFGFKDDVVQRVAYLHDIIEDTEWTSDLLLELGFDPDTVMAVEFCTNAEGENRKTRKTNTYERVQGWLGDQPPMRGTNLGVVVKWADRLANLRACHRDDNKDLLKMYSKEAATFRAVYMPPHSKVELFLGVLAEYDRLVAR